MIRVLVVDDDYMIAKVHAAFVERTPGFTVVGKAHTGEEALRALAALSPDLILLDIYLPDTTGLQLLKQVRSSASPAADVEIVMITAANDVESVKQAMRGGVASYLIKPFQYEDLRSRLEQVAERRRRLEGLATSPAARQQDVDRVFGGGDDGPRPSGAGLPKGLAAETVQLVERVLRDAGQDGMSASECAESTGMSRVSARRYLEYLADIGAADVSAKYGGTGRPERRFRAT